MNKSRRLDIEKTAETIRSECNVTGYGVQNVFEAAEKIGYRVIRFPLGEDAFLGLSMIRDAERIVFTNSSLILSREIFSVAHEIGHQMLHLSETDKLIIADDENSDVDECEKEANYFAACLLMPEDKVEKFLRLELSGIDAKNWKGLDIARIQTAFSVSYDMALNRLKALALLDDVHFDMLKSEKIETGATKLLKAINGNVDLCVAAQVKKIPAEYLEWVISNYNGKLIPKKSLETALSYVDLNADDLVSAPENTVDDEDLDTLLKELG